jgi:NADH dehydrogenase
MHRVLIVGGGFAGVATARALGRRAEVTIVSEENSLLFTPMLAEVAATDLDPRHILAPLRHLCPHARIVIGSVIAVSPEARTVRVRSPLGGDERTYGGDALVIAAGSRAATFGVPGVVEHALPFREIRDALRIRRRLVSLLEESTERPDPALTRVIVVGAGYSGAELSAALADFLVRARRRYYRTAPEPRVTLVDAIDRVVPMLPAAASTKAAAALRDRHVHLVLGRKVAGIEAGRLDLDDGTSLEAATIIWAGGVEAVPLHGLDAERGRRGALTVDGHMQVADGLFALGDAALVPDGHGGLCPPTAQHALRQGAHLGKALPELLDGRDTPEFRYRTLGELVSLGHRNAIGRVLGVTVSGFVAWFLWRSYYLLRLPTVARKARVAFDWTLDLIFPPDIADPASTDLGPDL